MQVSIGTMAMPFDDRKEHTDGRKTLFHTVVYLLPPEDLRAAMTALTARPELAEQTPKERALAAVGLLQDAADRRGIRLKLNRTPKKE